MTEAFTLETDSTAKKKRKPSDDKIQIMVRVAPELVADIETFMAELSPSMRAKVDAATFLEHGKPHDNVRQAFVAFAIRNALKISEKPQRAFGTKIDEFVDDVMTRNLESFEQRPDNWWERVAITRSLLTSPEAGHNPNSVKRWLEEQADRVAAHHAAVGIEDATDHNRKAGKARKALQP
jgi:hypothetical protein